MALSLHNTTAPVFGHLPAPDMSFLQDVHPEVSDALLGFVYDPLDPANAALDDLLNLPHNAGFTGPVVHDDAAAFAGTIVDAAAASFLRPTKHEDANAEQHCVKKLRAAWGNDGRYGLADIDPSLQCYGGGNRQVPAALPEFLTQFVLPLPPPPPQPQPQPLAFVRAADEKKASGNGCQSEQSAAAKVRRKRISEKTAELSRLIPGARKMSTAEMLQEAARHVKLLQAQVGMLALMNSVGSSEKEKMPSVAQEHMHALLACGSVQERLAAAGKCLVPRKLVDAVARDKAVKSNPLVNRDLCQFTASLGQ